MKAILNGITYTEANFAAPPTAHFANDPIGDELQADTMTVDIVAGTGGHGFILTADGLILKDANGDIVLEHGAEDGSLPIGVPSADYGDIIELYNSDDVLICKMYVESIERVGRDTYRLTAISALGLLIKRTHYGGIYTGQQASTIIAEIMGTVPFTIGGSIGNELIYGHLPIASARDNLHVLLQALGASILKDENGDILFDYLDEVSVATLPANVIYLGEGDVQTVAHATDVIVVEHNFLQTAYDEEVTLFDNTGGAAVTSKVVRFDNPCYGLTTTGTLVVDSSGANYAIVSGIGTLNGFEYTHTQEEYVLQTGANGEQMTVAVRENELINATNSYNLAMRLAGYYGKANRATIAAAVSEIWTGHHIAFKNVYGDDSDGYVTEAEVALSVGTDKSQLTIATDYEVGPFGANYDSVLVIDTAGTWTVPAEMVGQHVRVICISGAYGGQAGFDGAIGNRTVNDRSGGSGGAGGAGGQGFRVAIGELDLTAASYAVTIGAGGAGGASNGALGTIGGDTTFDTIDSADGSEAVGYYDIINAVMYGEAGEDGIAGGAGGWGRGEDGAGVEFGGVSYNGGAGGGINLDARPESYYYGGGGGGAAAGNNGSNAGAPFYIGIYYGGGAGANASITPTQSATLGKGGSGGHGGGGGGGAGAIVQWIAGEYDYTIYSAGAGGSGGAGGQGSNGFVLVYYNA